MSPGPSLSLCQRQPVHRVLSEVFSARFPKLALVVTQESGCLCWQLEIDFVVEKYSCTRTVPWCIENFEFLCCVVSASV